MFFRTFRCLLYVTVPRKCAVGVGSVCVGGGVGTMYDFPKLIWRRKSKLLWFPWNYHTWDFLGGWQRGTCLQPQCSWGQGLRNKWMSLNEEANSLSETMFSREAERMALFNAQFHCLQNEWPEVTHTTSWSSRLHVWLEDNAVHATLCAPSVCKGPFHAPPRAWCISTPPGFWLKRPCVLMHALTAPVQHPFSVRGLAISCPCIPWCQHF